MAHRTNINSFLSAGSSAYPLLSAYGQLVALELALKEHFPSWQGGHDVPQFLADLKDSGIISLGQQLHTLLSSIPCTDKNGNCAWVKPKSFPDLRYTRHANDFSSPSATDAQLQELVDTVKQIIATVKSHGVTI